MGWAAFGKVDIMRSRMAGMKIRRKVLNECVIPSCLMTYDSETCALTTTQMDALVVAHAEENAWSG